MKEANLQWHPAFVAAMDLEFEQNRADLKFEKEYNLNTKPLEIDLLVIKKEASIQITSEIGKLFKGYNIVEYKSPEDHLDIDTFYKTLAYACLYKSYGKTVDAIKAENITISIIRQIKPVALFSYFKKRGWNITEHCAGIYYLTVKNWFSTQFVVTNELDWDVHGWLKALSNNLKKDDFQKLLDKRNHLAEKADKELADSILEVSFGANKKIFEELIGDESMYETLMEIMEPRIQKMRIQDAVDTLRDFGHNDMEIKPAIIKKFNLSEAEAEEYLQKP